MGVPVRPIVENLLEFIEGLFTGTFELKVTSSWCIPQTKE